MQSIWIFESDVDKLDIENRDSSIVEKVNDIDETLTTQLFKNEVINDYTLCRLVMDETMNIRARALGEDLDQVIIRNNYDVLVCNNDGTMIVFANKLSSHKIKEFFEEQFIVQYTARTFDLSDIMASSVNVRKTQFKKVMIETLSGSSLTGQQVHNTEMFDLMHTAGELTNVAVAYKLDDLNISFTISIYGSIVMYSTLSTEEYIDFFDELFDL